MSGQHTRGPWAVSKQKARRITANGVIICNAVLRNQGGPKHKAFLKDEHEAEANACLMAAAPEMLVALDALAAGDIDVSGTALIYDANVRSLLERARAAIAKARGEA